MPPIVNHGGLWASLDQNTIYTQGGHFTHSNAWNSSVYYVAKANIPEWALWKMYVRNHQVGWSDITTQVIGYKAANRTFAGTAASVANDTRHFWVGGVIDSTSPITNNDTMQSTNQMLEYDEATNTTTRSEYYSAGSTDGYWQGNLIHLPIGTGKGYLISLMSLTHPTTTSWVDPDGESGSFELGTATADFFNNELPEPRTRFCSALFYDKVDNTWHLWMHGGQKLSNQNEGVSDIYVLNMPSFIWSKVKTTLPLTNLIRSHTCHAVGGQLLIVGSHPPGVDVATNVTCDPEYLKVLSISDKSVAWTSTFSTNTTYRTPLSIQNILNGRRMPIDGFANHKIARDFNSTTSSVPAPPGPKTRIGPIVGGTLGGLAGLLVVVVLICCWVKRRTPRPNPDPVINEELPPPHAAPNDPPGVIKVGDGYDNELYELTENKQPLVTVLANHDDGTSSDSRHISQDEHEQQIPDHRGSNGDCSVQEATSDRVVRVSSGHDAEYGFGPQARDQFQHGEYSNGDTAASDEGAPVARLRLNISSVRSQGQVR